MHVLKNVHQIILDANAEWLNIIIFRWKVREGQNCDSSTAKALQCAQTWQPVSFQLLQGAFPQPGSAALHPRVTSVLMSLFITHLCRQLHNNTNYQSHCPIYDKEYEQRKQFNNSSDISICTICHKQKIFRWLLLQYVSWWWCMTIAKIQ